MIETITSGLFGMPPWAAVLALGGAVIAATVLLAIVASVFGRLAARAFLRSPARRARERRVMDAATGWGRGSDPATREVRRG